MLYLLKKEEREIEKGNRDREWINDKRKLLTHFNEVEHAIHLEKLNESHPYPYNGKVNKHFILGNVDFNMTDTIKQNALFHSDPKMTQYLLKKGVNVHQIDDYNENALFGALSAEKTKILIDAGIDIHHKNDKHQTALFDSTHDFEKFKLLIELGIDIHQKDTNGQNILFSALDVERVDYLVSKGVELNVKNNNGHKALHSMSIEVSQRMIDHGVTLENYPSNLDDLQKIFYFNPEKALFVFEQKKKSIENDVKEINEHVSVELDNNNNKNKMKV